jgi:hypothetical protein
MSRLNELKNKMHLGKSDALVTPHGIENQDASIFS